jgi:large subunit ribosomal protein L13
MTTTIIDASGLVLGRMATNIAKRVLAGEDVHIINSGDAIITGASKKAIQERYRFKREVGTARKGPFFPREPHLIVKRTVRGMLSYQQPSGRAAYKRIKAHIGVPKELAGQEAISIDEARREARSFMTVDELSRYLGGADRST